MQGVRDAEGRFRLAEPACARLPTGRTEPLPSTLHHSGQVLSDVVNVFTCCILNWEALTVMLPAFLLAGAITVFIPPTVVLRYLGAGSKRWAAYLAAVLAGAVLEICSCNIVPLFASIHKRGAGFGPAITLLYTGPAINILSLIFTFKVLGWQLGVPRLVLPPLLGVLIGVVMAYVFRREEQERQAEVRAAAAVQLAEDQQPAWRLAAFFGTLLALMIIGGLGGSQMKWATWPRRMGALLPLYGAVVAMSWRWFDTDQLKEWALETWKLIRQVVPILLVSVLAIGFLAREVPLTWMRDIHIAATNSQDPIGVVVASVFGSLMYFPILSEVAFTKALLKTFTMAAPPAVALLLTGSGLSLPSTILIWRVLGAKKTLLYWGLLNLLAIGIVLALRSHWQYTCACWYQ